jgi:phosphatidylglycerophosphate synthase
MGAGELPGEVLMLKKIPVSLTILRACLAPIIVAFAWNRKPGIAYAAVVFVEFAADIADGMLARRLGVATPALRKFDSQVDTIFYGAAAFTVWWVYPGVVRTIVLPVVIVLGLEVIRLLLELYRFGVQAAYHAWSAKVWGLSLATALIALMGFGVAYPFVAIAAWLGVIADTEGLMMSLILPESTTDVKSIAHALKIRRLHGSATIL